MSKKDYFKKILAGILFIVLGILLVGGVIWVIGTEKGFIQPKFNVTVLFKKVNGLGIGAPIRLSGVNVGTVGKIDFLDDNLDGRNVQVVLNLFKRYKKQLEKSTSFAIKTEGVLGGKVLEISSDELGPYVDLSKPILGEDPIDVQDLVVVFSDAANAFTETTRTMRSVVDEFHSVSQSTRRVMNRIEQKLIDGNLFKVF